MSAQEPFPQPSLLRRSHRPPVDKFSCKRKAPPPKAAQHRLNGNAVPLSELLHPVDRHHKGAGGRFCSHTFLPLLVSGGGSSLAAAMGLRCRECWSCWSSTRSCRIITRGLLDQALGSQWLRPEVFVWWPPNAASSAQQRSLSDVIPPPSHLVLCSRTDRVGTDPLVSACLGLVRARCSAFLGTV